MVINQKSFHNRIYRWWYRNKYGVNPVRSNLCPYMRTVLFWAPIRAVFGTWNKIGRVPINALTIPTLLTWLPLFVGKYSYNVKTTIFFLYGFFLFLAVLFGTTLGLIYFFSESETMNKIKSHIQESTFIPLLGEYLRSFHDSVCPQVEWK